MTDWKKLAAARGLSLADDELARLAVVLENLEQAFVPIASAVPDDVGPAMDFSLDRGKL